MLKMRKAGTNIAVEMLDKHSVPDAVSPLNQSTSFSSVVSILYSDALGPKLLSSVWFQHCRGMLNSSMAMFNPFL